MLARRCKRATRSRSATATSVTWRCFLCLSSYECWRVCLGAPPHVAFVLLCVVLPSPVCAVARCVCARCGWRASARTCVSSFTCTTGSQLPTIKGEPPLSPSRCPPAVSRLFAPVASTLFLPPLHQAASAAGGLTRGLVGALGCGANGILLSRVCVSTSASPAAAGDACNCAQVQ